MFFSLHRLMPLLLVGTLLSGCSPMSFLSSSFATLDSTSQSRGLGGYVSDGEIRTRYHFNLFEFDHRLFYYVKSNVYEARLLLMGCVPTEAMREDAVRLAWQIPGVKAVINEITIAEDTTFIQSAKDKWIATKLNTLLFFEENVSSRNYEVLVVKGIVYLVGIASSEAEIKSAVEVARGVSGVKKVVSYIRLLSPFQQKARNAQEKRAADKLKESRKKRKEIHNRLQHRHLNHRVSKD